MNAESIPVSEDRKTSPLLFYDNAFTAWRIFQLGSALV